MKKVISIIIVVLTSIALFNINPKILSVFSMTQERWERLKEYASIAATSDAYSSDDIEVATTIYKDKLIVLATDYPYQVEAEFSLRECKQKIENGVLKNECTIDYNSAKYIKHSLGPALLVILILMTAFYAGFAAYTFLSYYF